MRAAAWGQGRCARGPSSQGALQPEGTQNFVGLQNGFGFLAGAETGEMQPTQDKKMCFFLQLQTYLVSLVVASRPKISPQKGARCEQI